MASTLCIAPPAREGSSHFHLDHGDTGKSSPMSPCTVYKVECINASPKNHSSHQTGAPWGPQRWPSDRKSDCCVTAAADAQGPVPMPVFLLWSQSLHLPFHYQLPLDRVEGRDKLALPAGGRDKSPPVTPLEWHLGSQAPGPLPLGKTERGSSLGRQGLGQGSLGQKERRDQGSVCTARRRSRAPGRLCGVGGVGGVLGKSHVQRGPETTPKTPRLVPHPHYTLGG